MRVFMQAKQPCHSKRRSTDNAARSHPAITSVIFLSHPHSETSFIITTNCISTIARVLTLAFQMVSSLAQTQTFILVALISLVSAQRHSNQESAVFSISIPEQQIPIRNHPDAAVANAQNEETREKNARISLYAPSSVRMKMGSGFDCKGKNYNAITLAVNTCLNGDYYPNNNMKVEEDPVCADGSAPFLSYYQRQGCKGKTHYTADLEKRSMRYSCLWSGYAPEEWSMIFRCGSERATAEGAEVYQKATPPPPPPTIPYKEHPIPPQPPVPLDEPSDATILSHLSPSCSGFTVGSNNLYTLKPDKQCATTPGYGIQIQKPAVCANGTRAKWARYEDEKCGYGHFPEKYGLMDIRDSDIGKCLSTGPINSSIKVRSIAFWCDGLKERDPANEPPEKEAPQARAGSVSESACMVGKAPFFNHPKTDTCVSLRTSTMKIYSSGVCANGTKALMAVYAQKTCAGDPERIWDLRNEEIETCLRFEGVGSFAFWCTGEIDTASTWTDPKAAAKAKHASTGKGVYFFLWLTFAAVGVSVLVGSMLYLASYFSLGQKLRVSS